MTPTRTRTRRAAAAAAVLLALGGGTLAACGSSDSTSSDAPTTTAKPAELRLTDAWARQSPAATTMGAAYLTITNSYPDRLTGASVPASVAKEAQIHEVVMTGGKDGSATTTTMGKDAMGTTTTMGKDAMGTTTTMGKDAMATTTTVAGMDDGSTTTTTMAMGGGDGMTMQQVTGIDLKPGKPLTLKPGGYHIMLIDLAKPLKAGDTFPLTLTFESAGKKTVTVTVRKG